MQLKPSILTTVLLSSLVTSSLASASLTVKLGGHMDMMVGTRQQKPVYQKIYDIKAPLSQNPATSHKKALVSDGRININIDSEEENNFKYGGLLSLNANPSDSTQGEKGLVSKAMFYVEHSKVGRFEAGNYYGAGGMFEMAPTNFAKAGYGVHGYWSSWINDAAYIDLSSTALGPNGINQLGSDTERLLPCLMAYEYIYSPNLPSNFSGKHYASAPKVTYYTIPLPGLTFGISFIPDLDSTGAITTQAGSNTGPVDPERAGSRPTFKNIFSGGFMYETEVSAVKLKGSVTGEIGKAKKYYNTDLNNDLKAYEIGLGATYGEYSIGATYGNWGKTGTYRKRYAGTKQGANYWTAVLAQQKEKLGYSLSYMQSKRAGGMEAMGSNFQYLYSSPLDPNNRNPNAISSSQTFSSTGYNKLQVISLGVDYKVAPGLMPYLEGTRFVFKNKAKPHSNSGYVILSGLRLSF